MEYQSEIREIEPVRVAYIKYKGFAPEANKVFPNEPRNQNWRYGTLCANGGHPFWKLH